MNIKLKRTTRTPYSEEIAILNAELHDENDEPVNIGKMDVHYADDQIVGTLLIWEQYATGYANSHPGRSSMDELIDAILTEVSMPVGVSGTYAFEVFYPSTASQGFFSNYPDNEDDEDEEDGGAEQALTEAGVPAPAWEEESPGEEEGTGKGDDFLEKLRQRPQ